MKFTEHATIVDRMRRSDQMCALENALVDGGTLRWKFYEALDGLTQAEIESLSLDDIRKREGLAMEQNTWMVAENVADRINHDPGPAGDYIQSFYFVTPRKNEHFFL